MNGATTQENRKHRQKYCFLCRRSDWNLGDIDFSVSSHIEANFNEHVNAIFASTSNWINHNIFHLQKIYVYRIL